MSHEAEVAAYLRLDGTLTGLLPGGVYVWSDLGEAGIVDATMTPAVWTGGVFQPCAVVRERQPVPDYRVQDMLAQLVSQTQAIEIWLYAADATVVESAADRVYALMQGHPFTLTWAAQWDGGLATRRAPELPNIWMARRDYRLTSLKVAA